MKSLFTQKAFHIPACLLLQLLAAMTHVSAGLNPMRDGGVHKPPLMLGALYEHYARSDRRQLTVDFSLFPAFGRNIRAKPLRNWPLSLLGLGERPRGLACVLLPQEQKSSLRASLLELGLGLSRAAGGSTRLRWRASLLDFDASEYALLRSWRSCRFPGEKDSPLDPIPLRLPFIDLAHGITILSFDYAGIMESDIRWLGLRGGLRHLLFARSVIVHATGGGALNTRKVGRLHFPSLGKIADRNLTGVEVSGEAGFALRFGSAARIGADAAFHYTFASEWMRQRRYGVELDIFVPLQRFVRCDSDVLQFFFRYEEIALDFRRAHVVTRRLQAGLQLSFGPEGDPRPQP